ncbi:hypothetical protein GCM10011506_20280 [Marivirga lumbricoides]|uniref:Transcriptional regulator n=1 Tax=Marivirga lumbricoides TaxID=1046115 RepID=A0ABQ1M8H4_9BACT|nr:hypothetical protein GCM10011506_20280 [Marivirga lumbricoides]
MSLKSEIEKIFQEHTGYSTPGQAANQASSLHDLSADLYTDSKRFIYELLQNADDSSQNKEAIKVWIKTFEDYLVVAHSGKPFSSRDLQGICNVNHGTKKSDPTKTGYKGIGFKSVFGQSEHVIIFTNGEYFRFDSSYQFGWTWEDSKEVWEKENDRDFQFPWQIIPIFTEVGEVLKPIDQYIKAIDAKVATIIQLKNQQETREAIQVLSKNLNMFLFLRNISGIDFDIQTPTVSIEIDRTIENKISLKEGGRLKTTWLIKTFNLAVPDNLKTSLQDERNIPDKLLKADAIELSMAAELGKDGIKKLSPQDKLLYSYLPTDETRYSLPVLINTSFLTTASREKLHADSKWNQWLFKTIPIEIFKWISELVTSDYEYQAYQLIPDRTVINDLLAIEFNSGIEEAIKSVPFIITDEKKLAKIDNTIVDFTFLSDKDFVGREPIKNFINQGENNKGKFAANTGFGHIFKKLGASSFEWSDVLTLLKSQDLSDVLSIDNNIQLIKHLKILCESEKPAEVSIEFLKKLPFIRDHKAVLNTPSDLCFPAPDDQNWNDHNSELSFIHPELKEWLVKEGEMRVWFETLGMLEKTDITFIHQTLIPNIESYVTSQNAIQTIQDLFILYRKDQLKEDLIKRLSKIKLLTQKGTLQIAEECYLSNFYSPRLEIEEIIDTDIFVSQEYCTDKVDKDEWKRFFKLLGVKEGIYHITFPEKTSTGNFTKSGWLVEFFNEYNNRFYNNRFSADSFSNLSSLSWINETNSYELSTRFWKDVIEYIEPEILVELGRAYWGYSHMGGQTNGDAIENYVPWFIVNRDCIPVVTGECKKANSVLLNADDTKSIAGNYLPVFSGPELTPDWKSFFGFRTRLELSDYLDLLDSISLDTDDEGRGKNENYKRIQTVYALLLDQCPIWNFSDISLVEEWSRTGRLLNTKRQFTDCDKIKCFIDGNDSIFQDQFHFLSLNSENKRHKNLETLLTHIKVTILRQSDFELIPTEEETCSSLEEHLKGVIPYFKIWIQHESNSESETEFLDNLQGKVDKLKIYQATELKITYSSIDFSKNVNVHFDKPNLFVTSPWDTNSVLLKLPEILARYFQVLGHEKKLDFLLRSNNQEILEHFSQENIDLPDEFKNPVINTGNKISNEQVRTFSDVASAIDQGNIPPEFFHLSKPDYERLKWIETLIPRAVANVMDYLKTLSEYDCANSYHIAPSIIRGITKNGNEITVVARPSDGNKVLLYYTSEFNVLQYVDAELWGEDGINPPIKITLGQLLRETGINRIPIKNISFSAPDFEKLATTPKSEEFDFDVVPFAPEKIARLVSSFANSNGGKLVFGIREIASSNNEIVGLSNDFRVVEITRKAISLLNPIPTVSYDWIRSGEKSLFAIETEKSDHDILYNDQKYIRKNASTEALITTTATIKRTLNLPKFKRTVAIIIGIENYLPKNKISPVKYANADVSIFRQTLIDKMNVDERDIHVFQNEEALKSSLEYDLKGLFYYLTEEDRLIFYYVGHGFHNGITNFLSTYDSHKHHISETSVSLNQILLDPLRKSKCNTALIFIDACAQSFQDALERNHISDINEEEIQLLVSEFPYYATFLSCQPGQKSYSSDSLLNGIFTYHLSKALNGNAAEALNGKYVTDRLLKEYLSKSVAEYVKSEQDKNQNPRAILDSSGENVIVEIISKKI